MGREGALRYSLFERALYDPLTKNVEDRYSKYYDKGSISQDLRFGKYTFHGLTFNANGIKSLNHQQLTFNQLLERLRIILVKLYLRVKMIIQLELELQINFQIIISPLIILNL